MIAPTIRNTVGIYHHGVEGSGGINIAEHPANTTKKRAVIKLTNIHNLNSNEFLSISKLS
jgi:hypothetical protein